MGAPGTFLLVTACVVWSAACFLAAGTPTPGPAVLLRFGAKGGAGWPLAVHLVHADPVHLLGNVFALWHLGDAVEAREGVRAFAWTVVAAGAGGVLASAVGGPAGGCGASALVFGLGARLALREGLWPLAALALLTFGGDGTDGWAHAGGAVGGLCTALLVSPARRLGSSVS